MTIFGLSLWAAVFLAATAAPPRVPGAGHRTARAFGDQPPLPPRGIPVPDQFPRKYETRWFKQPVDHFNMLQPVNTSGDRPTFQQRYLWYAEHWGGPGHPIIFYTGAEGSGVPAIWDHSGWVVDTLARNLSALFVLAEHRYFGESFPFGDAPCELSPEFNASCESSFWPNATRLGLLHEEQTLADYAALAIHLRTSLKAPNSPLISIGGSLAGELTTYFRFRYPHIVDAGIASSAPILGYPGYSSPFGWYQTVTEAFRRAGGDTCVEQIRAGFWMLRAMSPAELSKAFNTCTPATKACHYQAITQTIYDWCGGAAEAGFPPSRSTINLACDTMKGAKTNLEAWQKLWAPIRPATCLNVTWECSYDDESNTTPVPAPPIAHTPLAAEHTLFTNGWDFLACTSEVHPIGSNNVTDFLPPVPWLVDGTLEWCQSMFDNTKLHDPHHGPASKVFMRADSMIHAFGLGDLAGFAKSTSRIIFSSGQNDPWSAQSITKTLSADLPAVVISLGAHHSDLGGPMNPVPDPKTDTQSLNDAREFEILTLRRWIDEIRKERAEWTPSEPLVF